MLVVHVHARVDPERVAEFLTATVVNARASLAEPGVLRFDVVEDQADPAHVVLTEVYRDDQAAAAHKPTSHYAVWRDAVAEMMVEPRRSTRYSVVFPQEQRLGQRLAVTAPRFEFATAGRVMAGPGRVTELPGCWPGSDPGSWCSPARTGASCRALGGLGLPPAVLEVAAEPTVQMTRAGVATAGETAPTWSPRSAVAASSIPARRWPRCSATGVTRWTSSKWSGADGRSLLPSTP